MKSLDAFARSKLAELDASSLRRGLVKTERSSGAIVMRHGRRLISFSCNDYLGLSQHPRVKAAAMAAIETYGAGAGASRLVTGNYPLLDALEARLAQWKHTEAARVLGSGYLTNLGIIPALARDGDLILIDELAHACIFAGGRLSPATTRVFRHNDVEDANAILKAERGRHRHALLVTDHIFSMDGDRAPVAALADICATHDTWLMTDDAHGLAVLDEETQQAQMPLQHVPLQMGTLSKALGSYGGYLCASRDVIDLMTSRARPLVYSTALPPASAAAAMAALEVIAADPALCARPLAHARAFTPATRAAGRAKPDRPARARAGGNGTQGLKNIGRGRLSRCRDPAADGPGGLCPASLRVFRRASRRRCSPARRRRGTPRSSRAGLAGSIIVPALFITATGTDIGKTFVTTGLIRVLCRHGRKIAALKPIVTGFDAENFAASDPALLLEACGRGVDLDAIAAISPWRFVGALSPDMAAAQEGKVIDASAVHRFCADAIAQTEDVLLIEGIGGLMVPLDAQSTVCDLIAALKVPMILVAGTYLGSLSHTLTALEVAQKRDLPIAALVLNETKNSGVIIEAARESLGHFWKGPIVTILHNDRNAAAFEQLVELLPPASSVA